MIDINTSPIRIIATGGTIDKVHDPISEQLVFQKNSHIDNILKEANINHIHIEILMMMDSLDMTEEHRKQILSAIEKAPETKIVITHGTSTMDQTALYLENNLKTKKTIIITGALRPYSLMKSDSEFNLGGAVIAAQILDDGVYVVMSGQIFKAGGFRKNPQTARFEPL